jgi:hypothetical protein
MVERRNVLVFVQVVEQWIMVQEDVPGCDEWTLNSLLTVAATCSTLLSSRAECGSSGRPDIASGGMVR